ncbi:hypothetical protein HC928_19220 [bacterium]|nr:hypothetical protein [bacterium]
MGYSLHYSYWLTLAIAVPTAGCLMRIFCIQHDCGHRAFFRTKKANDRLGFVCSIFTLTPYHFWLKSHAYHHIHLGNLDFRETGYIKLKTVREYLSLNAWDRFLYRLYRSPLVLFLVGPPLQFAIIHRFTFRVPTTWKQEKKSVHITNFTLAIALAIACLTVGAKTFLLTYAPILILGSSLGVWVFYIQHTFQYAYWHRGDRWSLATASVASSSYYCLPRILQWFTLNNGIHHIHH